MCSMQSLILKLANEQVWDELLSLDDRKNFLYNIPLCLKKTLE